MEGTKLISNPKVQLSKGMKKLEGEKIRLGAIRNVNKVGVRKFILQSIGTHSID